ncbi:uncharacterized protein LOC127867889 [Dreissena polymorpha]|uniref:uncharacterized protein LOC127867889 n=1 Tax=Dreissena polymorpha TaxID=45954 RepID=UPI0022642764|nr:uncharacterized protein LOC127867889 [Dreissena polymorpha]XP_052265364.1 uncharacterized protein LOC127867889 [Dreissena polymorpha]XP_052265365.1 uncharacterized protein LOC127867889 [Dreissena polymorpha]
MDLATGTSCFKNRQERASLKDDDGSVSRNEPSSCAENNSSSSSPGSKMSTNSQSTEIMMMMTKKLALNLPVLTAEMDSATSTSCFKNRQERASLRIRLVMKVMVTKKLALNL